ncbi:hypothetical protein RSAG8_06345, partial [Rhizoctonia solani AG-8 WAC10335]
MTTENLQSTLRVARSSKKELILVHTTGVLVTISHPGLRASSASSMGGNAKGESAKGAGDRVIHLEGKGEDDYEEGEGDNTYTEVNTGLVGISGHVGYPLTGRCSSSEQISTMGIQTHAKVCFSVPLLAPSPKIGSVATLARERDKKPEEPSPGRDAQIRHSSSLAWSWEGRAGGGSSKSLDAQDEPPSKVTVPKVTRREILKGIEGSSQGNTSETRREPQINRTEQARIDFANVSAVQQDNSRMEAMLEYAEQNGGQVSKEIETGKGKEKEPDPVTVTQPGIRQRAACLLVYAYKTWRAQPMPVRAAVTSGGDPSDSSDSSDTSSSDGDKDHNNMNPRELDKYIKKLKKKRKERKEKDKLRRLQLSGFKTKLPTTYNGSSDFDTYEQFVYKVEIWVEDTGFKDPKAVRHIKGFLKDKAANFYMSHVATEASKYMLTAVFQELFDYCFPPNIQVCIHRKFNNMTQTDRGFRDFYRELHLQ